MGSIAHEFAALPRAMHVAFATIDELQQQLEELRFKCDNLIRSPRQQSKVTVRFQFDTAESPATITAFQQDRLNARSIVEVERCGNAVGDTISVKTVLEAEINREGATSTHAIDISAVSDITVQTTDGDTESWAEQLRQVQDITLRAKNLAREASTQLVDACYAAVTCTKIFVQGTKANPGKRAHYRCRVNSLQLEDDLSLTLLIELTWRPWWSPWKEYLDRVVAVPVCDVIALYRI